MANYWMEDYESGSLGDEEFEQLSKVIERCIDVIKRKTFVRIGYIILDEMKIEGSKHDLIYVAAKLEETGKYQIRYVKHKNGRDDFLVMKVPKKAIKERYWFLMEIVKYLAAGFIGYAISLLVRK
jgi:hypothetical protein